MPPEQSLCRQCGLCCDGTLFADVLVSREELKSIDAAVGYENRDSDYFLQQPCLAFCNGDCKVYENRPSGCRRFECHLLQEVKKGQTDLETAQQLTAQTRVQVQMINQILHTLGEQDESLPLTFRYETALSQALDLSKPDAILEAREALYSAVTNLENILSKRYRPIDDEN